jgi:putative addiction module component (TIGR02574 family)
MNLPGLRVCIPKLIGAAPVMRIVRSKNEVASRLGAPYNEIMTTEEVKALPVDEKIRMMEAIWEDFRERFDRMEISQEQKDLLDQRRARVREGKARLLDWDSVKGTIGR